MLRKLHSLSYIREYINARIMQKNYFFLHELLSQFSVLQLTNEIYLKAGIESGKLESQGLTLDYRDIFIGVCAREHSVCLKTGNMKYFQRISGLNLIE